MQVKKLSKLKDLAVFWDYTAHGDETDFYRHSLIYGFNGTGKTTLSRVFASLECGERRAQLPEECRFDVELDDGTIIGTENELGRIKGKLVVFNSDYVEANFRWKDGTATAVFYIGQEQADLARSLQEDERKQETAQIRRDDAKQTFSRQTANWTQFKRDLARNISEQTAQRTYNATKLDSDYESVDLSKAVSLPDERRQELRSILLRDAPLARVAKLSPSFKQNGFSVLVHNAIEHLGETSAEMILDTLRDHQSMVGWTKEGLDYHRQHNLKECLFCANQVSEDRLKALAASLNGALEDIITRTQSSITNIKLANTSLLMATSSLPSANDLVADQSSKVAPQIETYRKNSERAVTILDTLLVALSEKEKTPNLAVTVSGRISSEEAASLEKELGDAFTAMNEAIDAHNAAHDNFFAARASAAESLKIHYLLESSARYLELKDELNRAEANAKETDDALSALDDRIIATRQKMRQHGPAAAKINSLIKSFLRHNDVEIAAVEEGFEIRRHGKTVTGTLSEGERTAVAFCYFLSTLEAENRKLSDLIVVIDDPISSLDTKALNYAFALIKSHLTGAKQLVILTHNINFMSLCVKWLKKPADKKEASLLFIDMRQAPDGKRTSSLVKMPKLIREYESEYHYLFCLVKDFEEAKSLDFAYTYLMPNAMRKVMDIFLAFKLPGGQGLENKVANIIQKAEKYGLDAGQVKALERLAQVESHADSLDDLVGFSSMVFEEALSAAQALMEMMKNMDGDHYKSMIKLCS